MTGSPTEEDCMSDIGNRECFKFAKHDFQVLLWVTIGVDILAVVVCYFTIVLVLFLKAYKRFVHRLTLYLSITEIVISVINIIRVVPIKHNECHLEVKENYADLCKVTGFLLEYSALVALIFLGWVTFHLFVQAVFKRNLYKSGKKREVVCVIAAILAPVPISIIPLTNISNNGIMYGLAVPWCWIKLTNETCNTYNEGLIEQCALFYGPIIALALFNLLAVLAVIVALCKTSRGEQFQEQRRKALKKIWPLILYPIFFNIIFLLTFGPRIYYNVKKKSILGLWVIHAMALPCIVLFIPLAFLIHPYTMNKCFQTGLNQWRHHSQRSHTHFVVSQEDSSVQRLVIRGSERTMADHDILDHI